MQKRPNIGTLADRLKGKITPEDRDPVEAL